MCAGVPACARCGGGGRGAEHQGIRNRRRRQLASDLPVFWCPSPSLPPRAARLPRARSRLAALHTSRGRPDLLPFALLRAPTPLPAFRRGPRSDPLARHAQATVRRSGKSTGRTLNLGRCWPPAPMTALSSSGRRRRSRARARSRPQALCPDRKTRLRARTHARARAPRSHVLTRIQVGGLGQQGPDKIQFVEAKKLTDFSKGVSAIAFAPSHLVPLPTAPPPFAHTRSRFPSSALLPACLSACLPVCLPADYVYPLARTRVHTCTHAHLHLQGLQIASACNDGKVHACLFFPAVLV